MSLNRRRVLGSAAIVRAAGRGLDGRVVLPGGPDYPQARQLFQPRYGSVAPAAVASRRSAEPVVPHGGGHGYAGWSTRAGRLDAMAAVSGEGTGVRVGAGARLGDVTAALARRGPGVPTGLCPSAGITGLARRGPGVPTGLCPSAGITGLTPGGPGLTSRAYGARCDRLIGARTGSTPIRGSPDGGRTAYRPNLVRLEAVRRASDLDRLFPFPHPL